MIKIPGPIPIYITPFFWVMAAAIGWFTTHSPFETLLWVTVIFLSVLIHELGHALTSIAFGQKVLIELTGYGGVTIRRHAQTLRPWKEFLVGLNGPLAGFLLCGVAYFLSSKLPVSQGNSVGAYMLSIAVYVNLYWTIINLLPIQPLDGGKLLRVVLETIFGVNGTKLTFLLSIIVASIFGILFFIEHAFLPGSIFFILAYEGYRDWKSSLSLTEHDKNEVLQNRLKDAQHDLDSGNIDQALKKFMGLREEVKSGIIYEIATQSAGGILYAQGDKKQAYALLSSIKTQLNPVGLQQLQRLAYKLGHMDEAASLGTQSFQSFPDYETALINACAHAQLGHVKPAIGWIQCAINEGLPNPAMIFQKEEFNAIRRDPLFQETRDKYASNGP